MNSVKKNFEDNQQYVLHWLLEATREQNLIGIICSSFLQNRYLALLFSLIVSNLTF